MHGALKKCAKARVGAKKTAANGRARMERGNECGRGAGGEKARKKTAREWSLRKREFWHGAGREKAHKKIGAGVGVERWKGLAHKINARRARERLTICRQTAMIFLKKHIDRGARVHKGGAAKGEEDEIRGYFG